MSTQFVLENRRALVEAAGAMLRSTGLWRIRVGGVWLTRLEVGQHLDRLANVDPSLHRGRSSRASRIALRGALLACVMWVSALAAAIYCGSQVGTTIAALGVAAAASLAFVAEILETRKEDSSDV